MSDELGHFEYTGARAMILLHEHHLRSFVESWRAAKASNLSLPQTSDPSYASLDHLLRHLFSAARRYMLWMCEMLDLPIPEIEPAPDVDTIESRADTYLEHLLRSWRHPLSGVKEDRFYKPEYLAPWKVRYCIDAMLEHAVMHPVRHRFQLTQLLGRTKG